MPNYDGWKLDSGQEDKLYGECEHCQSEIYIGQDYYKSRAGYFCDSTCFSDYMREYYGGRYEVAE